MPLFIPMDRTNSPLYIHIHTDMQIHKNIHKQTLEKKNYTIPVQRLLHLQPRFGLSEGAGN